MSLGVYVLESLLFIGLYIASYFIQWWYQLSFYGIVMFVYLVLQLTTARQNQRSMDRIMVRPDSHVILLIVGHRENPDYWMQCLQSSIRLHPDTPLVAIYVVVDGDEVDDKPMYDTAVSFFQEHHQTCPVDISIVSKRGKRGVMAYGFQKMRYDLYGRDLSAYNVVVTDSDTILDPYSLLRLNECLESDPRNGCATGQLFIFNKTTVLTRMIDARYAYAFNIERACASYFGCMGCCSGPLSIYRLSALNEVLLQRFVSQHLCGMKCEPGDDRHLTNLVMAEGYRSRQTHLAIAGTEAPEVIFRYILQQLRWNRSFYRELKWQIKCMPVQSLMLHFMSIYELMFPFFMVMWCINLFFFEHSLLLLLRSFVFSVCVLCIRTIILTFMLRKNYILYGCLYYVLYFIVLLPLKVFAVVTVANNSWVTPSRSQHFRCIPSCSWDAQLAMVLIVVWNLMTVGCTTRLALYHNDVVAHFTDGFEKIGRL